MLNLFTPRQVQTVGQLLSQIKKLNEQQFKLVWVEGEVKNFTRAASGHLYFSLSDGTASMRVVMFRNQAAFLRFAPQEGQKILCRGQVSVYTARGELQFIAETLEPLGAGAAALALAQLKQRLAAQGLFAVERKRPLPLPARRVLLLTSLQGAAVHDFLKVMHRAPHGMRIKIWPIQVQGSGALDTILSVFTHLPPWPDVLVITRGGGSSQDLEVFNEEALVRAVAACPVPVLSAVGHEVDISLCDLAADARAATPTAAAEMLLQPWENLQQCLRILRTRLLQTAGALVNMRFMRLDHIKARLRYPSQRIAWLKHRLRSVRERLRLAARHGLERHQARLEHGLLRASRQNPLLRLKRNQDELAGIRQSALHLMRQKLAQNAALWQKNYAKANALNPLAVLARGYSLAQDAHGQIIRKHNQVTPGDKIKVRLARGALLAKVEETFE